MKDSLAERAEIVALANGVEMLEARFERHVYERHSHDAYAIGVTLYGVQRFSCRGRRHDNLPGQVMVIGPGEVHDGESGAFGGYGYRMLYLPAELVAGVLREVWSEEFRG